MNFKPLHDKMLIKLVEVETKTSGGILIPDNAQQKPSQGEVIAVGSGVRNKSGELIALSVSVGDKVFFEKWAGKEIKLDGVDYLIIKESDVLGIIG